MPYGIHTRFMGIRHKSIPLYYILDWGKCANPE